MQHVGNQSFLTERGGKQQLVLFDRDGPRYTIHGDLLGAFSVERAATGTALLSINMRASDHALRIPEMLYAEPWAEPPGEPRRRVCLGRFRIDFWQAHFDESMSEITIHGRGALGQLIDEPRQVAFTGELGLLVASLCAASGGANVVGIGPHPISVYVSMESTYAALRLLGLSLGFVIKEDVELFGIKIVGQDHERRRLEEMPMIEINDGNTLASTYTKGAPLKKRV